MRLLNSKNVIMPNGSGGQVQDQAAADREREQRTHRPPKEDQWGDPNAAGPDQGTWQGTSSKLRSKSRKMRSTSKGSSAKYSCASKSTNMRSSCNNTTSWKKKKTTSSKSSMNKSTKSNKK